MVLLYKLDVGVRGDPAPVVIRCAAVNKPEQQQNDDEVHRLE